jgi:hypothetical protein
MQEDKIDYVVESVDTSSLDKLICPYPFQVESCKCDEFELSTELSKVRYLNEDIVAKDEILGDGSCAIYSSLFPSENQLADFFGITDFNTLQSFVADKYDEEARHFIASCILSSIYQMTILDATKYFQDCLRYFANSTNESIPTILSSEKVEKIRILALFTWIIEDDIQIERADYLILIHYLKCTDGKKFYL